MGLRAASLATVSLQRLAGDIRACRVCRDAPELLPALPHEPRPVFQVSETARLCIAGQAPGTRVHASGTPFTDPSGDRLRQWLSIGEDVFYDASRMAIIPMGFCFPGLDAKGGDLPPRRECAVRWRHELFAALPQVELIIPLGRYAQKWHLGGLCRASLSETVADWRAILARPGQLKMIPLPHPSWRNNTWLKVNPWFEAELLPVLREKVREAVG